MFSIKSLLNPSPVPDEHRCSRISHQVELTPERESAMAPPAKKVKMTKDAVVLHKGKVHGQIVYPPFEGTTEAIATEHRKLQLHPMGQIAEYHRHIPYTSEKKSFLKKTGRESFEVFQYTFKLPGHDKVFNVMWDYNIGLVRMTPFFKACGYPKTMPAKMMSANRGLKDISHSITGGALAAQGYWVPYAAAKAAASTFCYPIRYALTPLFGVDFPETCIKTGEENFGSMTIDPKIIRSCTEQAARYYAMSTGSSRTSTPRTSSPSTFESDPSTPPSSPLSYRSLRSRLAFKAINAKREYTTGSERAETEVESGSGESTRTSPAAMNPYTKHLNKPYFAPDYELNRSSAYKWQARSPSPKSSSAEESPVGKNRSVNDIDDNHDSNDDNYSPGLPAKLSHVAPVSKKRKRCINLSADELLAVCGLMKLNASDDPDYTLRRASL